MKKHFVIFVAVLTFFLFTGYGIFNVVKSAPNYVDKNFPVEKFFSVSIGLNATVYLEQGTNCSVDIDAPENVLEKIDVSVEDGKLIIRPKNFKTKIREEVIIEIVAPDYEAIDLAGSGKIIAEGPMNLEDVKFKIAGSGNMVFEDLSSEEVEIKISGSGNMKLKGEGAEEMEVNIAGSGNVDSEGFEVDEIEARISGSGNCRVFATGELEATIAGSGSVYYKGNPEVDASVAGSGKVKKF